MIDKDKEFDKEALVFWNKNWDYFNDNVPNNIDSIAYEYVKRHENFKYKDHVEAHILVDCLVEFGYIEFTKRENDIRYHSLTEKGLDFIKEKNKKNKN